MKASSTAGYSGTPLARKLGIKERSKILLLGAPAEYFRLFEELPADVQLAARAGRAVDIVHVFVTRKAKGLVQ